RLLAITTEYRFTDNFVNVTYRSLAIGAGGPHLEINQSAIAAARVAFPGALFQVERERWIAVIVERTMEFKFRSRSAELSAETRFKVFPSLCRLHHASFNSGNSRNICSANLNPSLPPARPILTIAAFNSCRNVSIITASTAGWQEPLLMGHRAAVRPDRL